MDSSTIVHDVELLVKSLLAQFIPVLVCMVTIDGNTDSRRICIVFVCLRGQHDFDTALELIIENVVAARGVVQAQAVRDDE